MAIQQQKKKNLTKIEKKRKNLMKQLHEEGWVEAVRARYSYFMKEGSQFRIEVHAKTIKVLRQSQDQESYCLLHFGGSSKIRCVYIRNGILVDEERHKSIEL